MANTSFVRSGLVPQPGSGEGITTGVVAQLFRTTGAVFTAEGEPITSDAINSGFTTAVANEYQASNGEFPFEDLVTIDIMEVLGPVAVAIDFGCLLPGDGQVVVRRAVVKSFVVKGIGAIPGPLADDPVKVEGVDISGVGILQVRLALGIGDG